MPNLVSNFSAEMIQAFVVGSEKPVQVMFPTRQKAMRFRFRMYALRKALQKEKHRAQLFADKCQIKIRSDEDGNWWAIVCPVDSDFTDALARAGIEVSDELLREADDEPEPTQDETELGKALRHFE